MEAISYPEPSVSHIMATINQQTRETLSVTLSAVLSGELSLLTTLMPALTVVILLCVFNPHSLFGGLVVMVKKDCLKILPLVEFFHFNVGTVQGRMFDPWGEAL
jgi:hypothetical protein